MNIIVNVDENWGIGHNGQLLFRIPEDMRRFKGMTEGKVVVMGSGTLKSLPRGLPLKNRLNIVLSEGGEPDAPGVVSCGSLMELFRTLERFDTNEVFAIGGQSVYEQLVDYCARAYVTKVEARRPADAFFPDIDARPGWTLVRGSEAMRHDGLVYTFNEYENNSPLSPSNS